MKHTLSLALIALAFTASAFAQNKSGSATITGYPRGIYSASETPAVSKQVGGVEKKILADLSGFKGNAILTINVYGNADETGKAITRNEDIGGDRAEELAKALAGPFSDLHNVTVRAVSHTNGTKYNERSAQVYWSIAPAPLPSKDSNRNILWTGFGAVGLLTITIIALLLKSSSARRMKQKWAYAMLDGTTYWGMLTPRIDKVGNVVGWETPFEGENHFRERFDQIKLAFKSSIKKSMSDPGYRAQFDRLKKQGKIREVASGDIIAAA
jgi:hypothetical protein